MDNRLHYVRSNLKYLQETQNYVFQETCGLMHNDKQTCARTRLSTSVFVRVSTFSIYAFDKRSLLCEQSFHCCHDIELSHSATTRIYHDFAELLLDRSSPTPQLIDIKHSTCLPTQQWHADGHAMHHPVSGLPVYDPLEFPARSSILPRIGATQNSSRCNASSLKVIDLKRKHAPSLFPLPRTFSHCRPRCVFKSTSLCCPDQANTHPTTTVCATHVALFGRNTTMRLRRCFPASTNTHRFV